MKEKSSYNIIVKGIVQGVGFRPFIYKTAERYHLKGYVKNSSGQVVIRTEGGEQEISSFIKDIENTPPPAAMIKEITVEKHEYEGFQTFRIRESSSEPCGDTFISPDLAMCPECKKELLDSKDRRFHYPFINCTNCGPRFTIIENTPYDRARTTMKKFPMCPLCSEEYHNPLSRRFHAQPNACHICGPTIKFKTENYEISGEKAIQEGVTRLKKGEIGGIKGLGGFHLACDAKNSTAIVKLRKLKERSLKPFALMAPNIEEIQSLCYLSQEEKKLLQSDKAPIVILKKKADCTLPFEVAGDIPYLGFMLPYTPLHFLILQLFGSSLIMTSGNISDYPLIFKNDEAIRSLSHIADFFILHDRDILNPCDDSVIQVFNNVQYPLRLGRGYSPKPLPLKLKSPVDILALGGELKNTISLLHGENAFI